MISQGGAIRFAKALLSAERDGAKLTFEQDCLCRLAEILIVDKEQNG